MWKKRGSFTGKTEATAAALRSTLAILWEECDGYSGKLLGYSFGLLLVGSAGSALVPVVYKGLIDAFTRLSATGPVTPWKLIGIYVLLQTVVSLTTAFRQFVHGAGTQRLNRRLSNRLFAHIVRLPLRFHLERKTGAVGETLNQGLNGCQMILQHAVFTVLPVVIEFLTMIVVLVHLNHEAYLGLIAASGIVYGWAFWRAAEGVTEPTERVSSAHISAHSTLTDSLLNYETIKYFAGEVTVCERYDERLVGTEQAWRGLLRIRTGYEVLLGAIFTASIAAALACSGGEVLRRTMSIGDFVLVNMYLMRIYQPLQAIGLAARDMSQGLAFLRQMLAILREDREGRDTAVSGRRATPELRGELAFENVSFAYNPSRVILHDISFCIPPGQTFAIVGTSGSGKSSIIRLLFRLFEPTGGRILLDRVPITELPLAELRGAIGVVPQDTILFNDTIGRNIAFGNPQATQLEVENAGRLARLNAFVAELPDGYSTEVGERGLKLSGGEKQRVAIARAALKRPSVYVFDEATSSLDSRTETQILDNLSDIACRNTTLIVAHRLSTVVKADQILVLDGGRIIERGSHAQLLSVDGCYASLWREQSGERQARSHQLVQPV